MTEVSGILKAGILGIIFIILLIIYIGRRKEDYLTAISAIILWVPGIVCGNTDFFPVSFLSIVFIAIVLGRENSIFFSLLLYIFASSFGFLEKKEGLFFLIISILISMLAENLKEKRQLSYSILLVISAESILLLINNNLSLAEFLTVHSVLIVGFTVAAMVLGRLAGNYYKKQIADSLAATSLVSAPMAAATSPVKNIKNEGAPGIDAILKEDFEPYRLLKASGKLYHHAEMVAVISEKAAVAAGLNEKLAKAGGLYHEIGKLKGKDYVAEGVATAKEYHMPEDVINIIASHNLKLDKPSSPEGAVVMFTVSLVAAMEYFQSNKKQEEREEDSLRSLMTKFTENLFVMRLEKDSLAECNLTVNQYIRLKQFYLDYFGEKEE